MAARSGGPDRRSGAHARSREARRPAPAVLLVERESEVRAYVMQCEAAVVRAAARRSAAAEHLLAGHQQPLELVLGHDVMQLVNGRELLDVLHLVRPLVPVILLSDDRWRTLRRRVGRVSDIRRAVPFDPEAVLSYLERLRGRPEAA